MRIFMHRALLFSGLIIGVTAHAQLQVPATEKSSTTNSVLTDPAYRDSVQVLIDVDKKFAADVLRDGGSAFANWFADDAVALNNKKPTAQGKNAIVAQSVWKPSEFQLKWSPDGARIGPHGEMGITWGHYEGRTRDNQGNLLVTSGRYLTVWQKDTSGQWKVLADVGNEGPPEAESCCSIH